MEEKNLLSLMQDILQTGTLPSTICLQTLVMIPKEKQGDFRGIGLIESVWKLSVASSTPGYNNGYITRNLYMYSGQGEGLVRR